MSQPSRPPTGAGLSGAQLEGLIRANDLASLHALSIIEASGELHRIADARTRPTETGAVVVELKIVNPSGEGTTPFTVTLLHPSERGRMPSPMGFPRAGVTAEDLADMPASMLAEVGADMTFEVSPGGPGLLILARETYEWAVKSHLERIAREPKRMDENSVDDSRMEVLTRASELASAFALKLIGATGQSDRLRSAAGVRDEYGAVIVELEIVNPSGEGTTPFIVVFKGSAEEVLSRTTESDIDSTRVPLLFQTGMDLMYRTPSGDRGFVVMGRGTYEADVAIHANYPTRPSQGVDDTFVDGTLRPAE